MSSKTGKHVGRFFIVLGVIFLFGLALYFTGLMPKGW